MSQSQYKQIPSYESLHKHKLNQTLKRSKSMSALPKQSSQQQPYQQPQQPYQSPNSSIYGDLTSECMMTKIKPSGIGLDWIDYRSPQTVVELDNLCQTPEGRNYYLNKHNQMFMMWALGGVTAGSGVGKKDWSDFYKFKGKKYHYLFQALSEIDPECLVKTQDKYIGSHMLRQGITNISALGSKFSGMGRYLTRKITNRKGGKSRKQSKKIHKKTYKKY